MHRQNVESSNLAAIGYDASEHVLEVEFLNGSVYRYEQVSPTVHEELMESESKGGFFHREIKTGPYEFVKIRGQRRDDEQQGEIT